MQSTKRAVAASITSMPSVTGTSTMEDVTATSPFGQFAVKQFGFGAEIGISTQKLHARGPMGLPELTTTTYVVMGEGHVRG